MSEQMNDVRRTIWNNFSDLKVHAGKMNDICQGMF